MDNGLDAFGIYSFAVREGLVWLLVAAAVYVLLRAGIFALPQIGLMSIGAYVSAIGALDWDLPIAATIPLSMAVTATVGAGLALLLRRLDGITLAIATIGFSEIVRLVARDLDVTGGAVGRVGVPRDVTDVHLVVAGVIAVALLVRLDGSRFGTAMDLVRVDQVVAAHQGIGLARHRMALFVATGTLCGAAGSLYVQMLGFVEPQLFDFTALINVVSATVLGGANHAIGPLAGVVVIFGAPHAAAAFFEDLRHFFGGIVLVLVIAFAPRGVLTELASFARHLLRKRQTSEVRASPAPATASAELAAGRFEGLRAGPAVSLSEVSKHYGGVSALDDVSFSIEPGELFGLIGPNGSGKSTLLNVLSGATGATTGEVRIGRHQLRNGSPASAVSAGVFRTFQGIRLVPDATVEENVRVGALSRDRLGLTNSLVRSAPPGSGTRLGPPSVRDVLAATGLVGLADHDAMSLPYGAQRRTEIARALMAAPRVLLLDEPTAGMSIDESEEIVALLRELSDGGVTVLLVEHDLRLMVESCHRLAVLNFGRLIALGSPGEVVATEEVIDAYVGRPS